jgi:thiosulfate reductase cytochrome b subunit
MTFGGWLAGARNWHFAMMWVLAVNGAVYLAFVWLHGEWRDLAPRRGDIRDAWEMIKFYLFVRKTHPRQGKHNALQKGVYFALPWLGVLAVLTGLAIWKPVQLAPLTSLFGGYVWARYWHFVVMLALVLLSVGHVFMVFAVDPQSLRSMITGWYDESRSPEARNARPFLRGRRKPVLAIATPAPSSATIEASPSPGVRPPPAGEIPPPISPVAPPPSAEAVPAVEPADAGAVRTEDETVVAADTDAGRAGVAGDEGETDGKEVGR